MQGTRCATDDGFGVEFVGMSHSTAPMWVNRAAKFPLLSEHDEIVILP
ncbi:MAG: hypothetical protein H6Q48_2521, partial [Deltaproteobacteria bacterium]|nr:hypothetical protein [Deltaproteobacteria bacterium]